MALFTKSIQQPSHPNDGLRVCIMRRPGEYEDWDFWMPKLSPSHDLLNAYKYEGLSWEDLQTRFQTEVLGVQTRLLKFLTQTAQQQNVTLLCWEETADKCHRRLVAEACQRIEPNLEVSLD